MSFRKLFYIAAMILAVCSCKKDEETPTIPGLNGTLKIVGLPEFISPGETVTLSPKGAVHPAGEILGYYWKVTPDMTKSDTTRYTNGLDKPDDTGMPSDGSFSYTFSDTLRTHTVYGYAYATGYSGLSAVGYTTTVKPGYNGSIQGIGYNKIADGSLFVRHMPYYYKKIGEQTWTLNNMAVRSGLPFRNAEVMSEVFGRFYSYEEAIAACDSLSKVSSQTWTLPSRADWDALEAYVSGRQEPGKTIAAAMMAKATFNGTLMWEYWPTVGEITNNSGFSAIPTGYANVLAGSFDGNFEYATFWTADEATETEAYYKYFICDQPGIFTSKGNKKSFGAAVRCIRK